MSSTTDDVPVLPWSDRRTMTASQASHSAAAVRRSGRTRSVAGGATRAMARPRRRKFAVTKSPAMGRIQSHSFQSSSS